MKKLCAITLIASLLLLGGCGNKEVKEEMNTLEGVKMEVKEGTLTPNDMTIIITDTTENHNIYGSAYRIDKKDGKKWVSLKTKEDANFNAIGYNVGEDNTLEMYINWTDLYGSLAKGTYRLVKSTSAPLEEVNHFLAVEFTIK